MHKETNNRQKDDWYVTPPGMVKALIESEPYLKADLRAEKIWEPCCGNGAISEILKTEGHEVISSDLYDRGYGTAGVDFLKTTEKPAEILVTNPPFKLANKMIQHAMNLEVSWHAWLLPLTYLSGQSRYLNIYNKRDDKGVRDKSGLSRVHVFSKRQTLWRGDQLRLKNSNSSMIDFGWFVFQLYADRPRIYWIDEVPS